MTDETILIVEDDATLRELIVEEVQRLGYQTLDVDSAESAMSLLSRVAPVSLIISDLKLPDASGLELLASIDRLPVPPNFIVVTAFGTIEQAVDALQQGADNFLTKPLNFDHLMLCIERVLRERRLRQEVEAYRRVMNAGDFHGIVGRSQPMQRLFEQIRIVGRARGPALVFGESGTGKELVARALHAESERANGPFLAVNCASIPDDLFESELFGHAAGAFTGANSARAGLLSEASGGSILLDEIGELPLSMQAKLLRALQEYRIRPVGADSEEAIDTRVIAATNRDLELDAGQDRFRADLFYRLETFSLHVPPLRDRDLDIDLLIAHFIARFARADKPVHGISSEAIDCLRDHDFPGNVRELSNAIERAVAFMSDAEIQVEDLPDRIRRNRHGRGIAVEEETLKISIGAGRLPTLSQLDREYAELVLDRCEGNKSKAAESLGIGRRTLYRLLASDDADVSD